MVFALAGDSTTTMFMNSNKLVGRPTAGRAESGRPCRGERWGCQPSLSNRRPATAAAPLPAAAAGWGRDPPSLVAALWSRQKRLGAVAEIMHQRDGSRVRGQ